MTQPLCILPSFHQNRFFGQKLNCNISPMCNTFLLDRKMYVSKKVFKVISEVEIYVSNECQKLVLSDNAFKDGFRLETKKVSQKAFTFSLVP